VERDKKEKPKLGGPFSRSNTCNKNTRGSAKMWEDFKALVELIVAKHKHVLMKGKHGIGKFYAIHELAAKNGWRYFQFLSHQISQK
jgi:transcriptional regulator with GAF, ATPase, and Fis domain